MTIPTQMSLHGFISTAPELAYGKSDIGRFRARIGIEQWHKDPDGSFTKLDQKGARNRNYFNPYIWRPALERAGVPDERENGCHALRHFYTSTALHGGETIKAVSEYLGHADPGFTLRTYTHLMEKLGAHQARNRHRLRRARWRRR